MKPIHDINYSTSIFLFNLDSVKKNKKKLKIGIYQERKELL